MKKLQFGVAAAALAILVSGCTADKLASEAGAIAGAAAAASIGSSLGASGATQIIASQAAGSIGSSLLGGLFGGDDAAAAGGAAADPAAEAAAAAIAADPAVMAAQAAAEERLMMQQLVRETMLQSLAPANDAELAQLQRMIQISILETALRQLGGASMSAASVRPGPRRVVPVAPVAPVAVAPVAASAGGDYVDVDISPYLSPTVTVVN